MGQRSSWTGWRVAIAAGLATALTSCGGAAAGTAGKEPGVGLLAALTDDFVEKVDDSTMGLHPGESMTFEVSLGGIVGGQAALAVGEPGTVDGKDAIVVRSQISAAGALALVKKVQDDLTTTIDLATGLPTTASADVVFGAKSYHHDARYDGGKVELEWHQGDATKLRHNSYDFSPSVAHDAHSAMASMRIWEGAPGEARRLYLVGGKRIWQTDMTWVGSETIGTRLGNQQAIRLDGVSLRVTKRLTPEAGKKARTFSVWMSDDGDRAPLLVVAHTELGDVKIELTSYERP